MNININSFSSEEELGNYYCNLIKDAIVDFNLNIDFRLEVAAPGCIPDMVLFDREESIIHYLVSFEFKLSNWKQALKQAFKYKNFGNESYVILDKKKSTSAIKNLDLFKKVNIGLLTIENKGKIEAWFLPKPSLPFSRKYSFDFASSLLNNINTTQENMLFATTTNGKRYVSEIRDIWLPASSEIN